MLFLRFLVSVRRIPRSKATIEDSLPFKARSYSIGSPGGSGSLPEFWFADAGYYKRFIKGYGEMTMPYLNIKFVVEADASSKYKKGIDNKALDATSRRTENEGECFAISIVKPTWLYDVLLSYEQDPWAQKPTLRGVILADPIGFNINSNTSSKQPQALEVLRIEVRPQALELIRSGVLVFAFVEVGPQALELLSRQSSYGV
nr:uncharacterized mitochondrial protein AtMg00860-like [Ipomoea batatas]